MRSKPIKGYWGHIRESWQHRGGRSGFRIVRVSEPDFYRRLHGDVASNRAERLDCHLYAQQPERLGVFLGAHHYGGDDYVIFGELVSGDRWCV